MNTARFNITLPTDVAKLLGSVRNKSAYIAEAIKLKKRLEEKEKKRKELEAAYRLAAREDFETYKEWEDTISDGLSDDER